ncbi:MAG: DUF2330 domain-containing protein [Deltaproteobacteria bacterium]|nr:MAG: DUF2330 domain-containing protein [Deltaproteobacteria bacterium]
MERQANGNRRGGRASRAAVAVATAAAVWGAQPQAASAFCGFYVSGADADLYNNATMVVLMRDGTRTVLSMQNNYQGPPEDFAMVVPVPVVLQKDNVKTLADEVFDRVDQLAAPRLVEYWEEDPCAPELDDVVFESARRGVMAPEAAAAVGSGFGVRIEAQFKVGEYDIVILSARDSTGLDTWLRREGYKIPPNSEPLLRPYVAGGWKFFVAKVDVDKVRFKDGQAMLSPLRFHYDSDEFRLPVRLGLVNSAGTQDLIVHILARGTRYEVANYKNVTIPTNIDVDDTVRKRFGEFYAALFDATLEKNPGAVVTEYAWDAGSCDPCPTPALTASELATLGGDVIPGGTSPWEFVVTRLHARYGKDSLGEDLVFKQAPPIAGGREWRTGPDGTLEKGATPAPRNNFQARYAIRHRWTGPIECEHPVRGRWGGPPAGVDGPAQPRAARDLAFVPRGGVQLASLVREDVPEIGLRRAAAAAGGGAAAAGGAAAGGDEASRGDKAAAGGAAAAGGDGTARKRRACGCASSDGAGGSAALLAVVAAALVGRRRRTARHR